MKLKKQMYEEIRSHVFAQFHAIQVTFKSSQSNPKTMQSRSVNLMHQDVAAICAEPAALEAAWKQLDNNRSGSVSTSEWMMWVKKRWPFVSSAVANQAFRRTLASKFETPPTLGSKHLPDTLARYQFQRIIQTLPICCEAEAMFTACDTDGDRRVSVSELKQHAKNHGMFGNFIRISISNKSLMLGLKLNSDQMNAAVVLLEKGAGFAGFCDWFLQQRGGDTAEEIAAVRRLLGLGL